MIENLPPLISVIFIITTFLTVYFFFIAANNSRAVVFILLIWLTLQGAVSFAKFYTITDSVPPRFILATFPPLIFIIACFMTAAGRKFIDGLNIKILAWIHIVRVPVEIVLLMLYLQGKVPGLMTLEGRNFDILSGITAPFIAYAGFIKKNLNKKIILIWNFISLGLLLNIIINAILSAPFPFQQFAFDQPNVSVLYFPFIWLPCCIVPIILFSHLVTIRQLIKLPAQKAGIL